MLGYRLPHKIEEEIMGRIEQEAEKYWENHWLIFAEEGVNIFKAGKMAWSRRQDTWVL